MSPSRRTILIGLAAAGFCPAGSALAAEAVEAGSVIAAQGAATGLLGGARRSLAAGVAVFIDDTLSTGEGARLTVRLGSATRLSLGERTRIRIDKFLVDRGGELTLGRGAMLFDRPEDPASSPLEVMTPFGLIAARGTKFFAGPSKGVFGVFVDHGVVTVRTRAGAVRLTDGQGTDIKSIRDVPTEPKAWAPARVAAALASVS